MMIEDYGIWISVRNQKYPVNTNFIDDIQNAISRDLEEEELPNKSTYRYKLYYNDEGLGAIVSFFNPKTGKCEVGTELDELVWHSYFNPAQQEKVIAQLSTVEDILGQHMESS